MKKRSKDKRKTVEVSTAGLSSVQSAEAIENTQWTKYHGKGGHGFAAEDANALNEKLRLNKVLKVGTGNTKNGADRITNGQMIQTKYYETPAKSVNAAFDKTSKLYKYTGQRLEVPKDQYDEAVKLMADKIREGKVPGITDSDKAKLIIKKGEVTHAQALNIAKAGNIDSLWFDVKTQSIVSSCAFGITFVIVYANAIWNNYDHKTALKTALSKSARNGSFALISGVVTQQLLRTSAGKSIATYITKQLRSTEVGKKVVNKIASTIWNKPLYGGAAQNVVMKFLRTNTVTTAVTTVVIITPEVYKALIAKNISWTQVGKNFVVNTSGLGGGLLGAWGGSALGEVIGSAVFPGPGTVIGGKIGFTVGGVLGGVSTSMSSKKIADNFIQDDAQLMVEIMNEAVVELCYDYLITEAELENNIIPKIKETVNPKWLQKMFKYGGSRVNKDLHKEFAYKELECYFIEALSARSNVVLPSPFELRIFWIKTRIRLFFARLKAILCSLFIKKEPINRNSEC